MALAAVASVYGLARDIHPGDSLGYHDLRQVHALLRFWESAAHDHVINMPGIQLRDLLQYAGEHLCAYILGAGEAEHALGGLADG